MRLESIYVGQTLKFKLGSAKYTVISIKGSWVELKSLNSIHTMFLPTYKIYKSFIKAPNFNIK